MEGAAFWGISEETGLTVATTLRGNPSGTFCFRQSTSRWMIYVEVSDVGDMVQIWGCNTAVMLYTRGFLQICLVYDSDGCALWGKNFLFSYL